MSDSPQPDHDLELRLVQARKLFAVETRLHRLERRLARFWWRIVALIITLAILSVALSVWLCGFIYRLHLPMPLRLP